MNELFPFLYPTVYSPGQFVFGNNAELSTLITMFSGPMLGSLAGPGNFIPNMMPGQHLFDQFTMRNYQQQTLGATYGLAGAQDKDLSQMLLGLRAIITKDAATDLNRSQAMTGAEILNSPAIKTILGMLLGPENVEVMHGARGDIQNLGSAVNRIGYFRNDPSGAPRMDSESLQDLTTGIFSHLYDPTEDVNKMAAEARRGDEVELRRLQSAARMENNAVLTDESVEQRLRNKGAAEVGRLYSKYVQGGEATDTATQAKELVKFDSAVAEAAVLRGNETTIGAMQERANRLPTDEMRGFMAGQVGQMLENLSQRGILPAGIGGLSERERVQAIAETKLDPATIDRLARAMAQRDLSNSNTEAGRKFRATENEKDREEQLSAAAANYRTEIEKTRKNAEEVIAGTAAAGVSPESVLKGIGGELLAGNVDATRAASTLKNYTEAIAAVRDIFGDNGNTNAPMPALLAALDQLTQGGMGQMDVKKAATTLRTMQTLARETGTGMQQLAQMSAVAGNMGRQLGIAPSITMQNVAMSMGLTKAAMERGEFSRGVPGTLSKEEFQMLTAQKLQESEAFGNAKAMAAMVRIYEENPNQFKDTELAAAVAAYKDATSDGTYTYDPTPADKTNNDEITKNLYETVGRGRAVAIQQILRNAGVRQGEFESRLFDPMTAATYNIAGRGYLTQKYERAADLSSIVTDGALKQTLSGTETLKTLGEEGTFRLSDVVTNMLMDSAKLGPQEQQKYMRENLRTRLVEHFQSKLGGEKTVEEAERMADEITQKTINNPNDTGFMGRLIGNLGTAHYARYGETLATGSMRLGAGAVEDGQKTLAAAEARAKAAQRIVGFDSTIGQRMFDYLKRIGAKEEAFSLEGLGKALMPVIPDQKLRDEFIGQKAVALYSLADMAKEYEYTREDIDAQVKKMRTGAPDAKDAETTLRQLSNIADDVKIVTEKEIEDAQAESIRKTDTVDALKQIYTKHDIALPEKEDVKSLQEGLITSERYKNVFRQQYRQQFTAGKYLFEDEFYSRAYDSVGSAKPGDEAAKQKKILDALRYGAAYSNTADGRRTGVDALFAFKPFVAAIDEEKQQKIKTAILTEGDSSKTILNALGLSEETYRENLKLSAEKKEPLQKFAELALALDSPINAAELGASPASAIAAATQTIERAEINAANVVINATSVTPTVDQTRAPETASAAAFAAASASPNPYAPVPNPYAPVFDTATSAPSAFNPTASPNPYAPVFDTATSAPSAFNPTASPVVSANVQAAVLAANLPISRAIPDVFESAPPQRVAERSTRFPLSPNIAANNSPQQMAVNIHNRGIGADGAFKITTGTLTVVGLNEAILEGTATPAISTPGNGASVSPSR